MQLEIENTTYSNGVQSFTQSFDFQVWIENAEKKSKNILEHTIFTSGEEKINNELDIKLIIESIRKVNNYCLDFYW